jgi:hypothetical protein
MPEYRSRIRELRTVSAAELRANPKNYRTHPEPQREALRGILGEVGIADALLAYETPEGLTLIDGHLRLSELADAEIPVLVLDVTEAEANKLLVTLDPLAAMAEMDAQRLDALLREVETGDQALAAVYTDLAEQAGILEGVDADGNEKERYTRKVEAPIYRPTGPKPPVESLVDRTKYLALIAEIDAAADIPESEKELLRAAAARHLVFHYERIAEYYAHSGDAAKVLFENSALIIIDWDKAIELGYVKLSKRLAKLYGEEYPSDDE